MTLSHYKMAGHSTMPQETILPSYGLQNPHAFYRVAGHPSALVGNFLATKGTLEDPILASLQQWACLHPWWLLQGFHQWFKGSHYQTRYTKKAQTQMPTYATLSNLEMMMLTTSIILTIQITSYPRLKLKARWQSMKFQFILKVAMLESNRLEGLERLQMVELILDLQGATFFRYQTI